MPLPRAVYLETSSLWGKAHRIDDPSLQTLTRYATALHRPLFSTSLIVDELVQEYSEGLTENNAALERARDGFARRGFVVPTVTWPTAMEQVQAELPQRVRGNLESYGVTILPNEQVNQERLLRMAVRKELPFTEKGEKGFRDSIIVFTVLAHARANGWGNIMVVSNDDAIRRSFSSIPEAEGIQIQIVNDIDGAVKAIDDFVDNILRQFEVSRKAACREAVLRERERVEEFIREKGVFPETLFFDRLLPGESLADIGTVVLTDVQVAALGELPEQTADDRVQVSLDAEMSVNVKVTPGFWPTIRRFRVGGEIPEDARVAAINRRTTQGTQTRTIPLKVKLEGSVRVRRVEPGREEFSDVRLQAFNPPSGGFASLLAGLMGEPPPPPPPPLPPPAQ